MIKQWDQLSPTAKTAWYVAQSILGLITISLIVRLIIVASHTAN